MPERPIKCPSCGGGITAVWLFCEACGQPLTVSAEEYLQSEDPTNSSKKRAVLVILLGLVFFCGCAVFVGGAYLTRQNWLPRTLALLGGIDDKQEQFLPTQPPTLQVVLQPTPLPTLTTLSTAFPSLTMAPTVATLLPQATEVLTQSIIADRFDWQDDFSSKESGWYVYQDSDGYASYHEGGVFAIALEQPYFELRTWPDLATTKPQTDVEVSVKGTIVEGSGYWGIIFRFQDEDTYYQLGIDELGYVLYKYQDGEETALTNPEWIDTDLLNPNHYENRLVPVTLSCIGSQIKVQVNDETLFETSDGSIPSGDIMLYADSYNEQGMVDGYYIKVLFDDFLVTLP